MNRINLLAVYSRPLIRKMSTSGAPLDYDKKVALITGSTGGIGQQTALLLAKNGASVILHGNNEEEAAETIALFEKEQIPKYRYHLINGDLEKESTRDLLVEEAIKKFNRLDVLVNNVAATGLKSETDFFSMKSLRYILEINCVCIADLTQKSVPHLMKTGGSIVNVSSTLSVRPCFIGQWYSVSKAALDQYTRVAASMYAPAGIRVNAVRVGAVNTKLYQKHGYPALTDRFISQVNAQSLLGRIGEPHEVANVIEFLANNKKSSYVSGCIYGVDGGLDANFIIPPADILDCIKDLGYQSNGLFPKPESN